MPALDNATLSPTDAPLSAEPNKPEAATLPPPLPGLVDGSIPAVLIPAITQEMLADPMIEQILQNFGQLPELGIDHYEASDASTVLYNSDFITEAELKDADENGTLAQIAVPLGSGGSSDQPTQTQGPLASERAVGAPPPNDQLNTARLRQLAPTQVSPVQPDPVINQLGGRPI